MYNELYTTTPYISKRILFPLPNNKLINIINRSNFDYFLVIEYLPLKITCEIEFAFYISGDYVRYHHQKLLLFSHLNGLYIYIFFSQMISSSSFFTKIYFLQVDSQTLFICLTQFLTIMRETSFIGE